MEPINSLCPLCNGSARFFATTQMRTYHKCETCLGVFLDRAQLVDAQEEKARYLEHNNEVDDPRYQDFVRPIVSSILADFGRNHKGLDFGAGTGPVITKMLSDAAYDVVPYDPYFHNFPELLNEQYDYIACCEVIEHFYRPLREFGILRNLLNPGGALYCMTVLYDESLNFEAWYYKNDQTHAFFYHSKSIEWIKGHFKFKAVEIQGRLITFRG